MGGRFSLLSRTRAFTLLEVMVSIGVLSLGLVVLLQVQARSIQMAQHAKALTVATQLARGKLYDCEHDLLKKGFSIGDYNEEGKFDEEGYDTFYWECHGYEPDLPLPDATGIAEGATQMAAEDGQTDPTGMMQMGVGMIAPVMGQISEVMKQSVRELVVIVKWREGEIDEEIQVATHLVDPTGINAIASQIQAATSGGGLLDSFLPGGGGGGGGAGGGTAPAPPPTTGLPTGFSPSGGRK